MKIIDWYDSQSRKVRNGIDQTIHVLLGFFLCLIGGPLLPFITVYLVEFYLQWPVERIRDTRQDMASWIIGTVIGHFFWLVLEQFIL
jgi:hypothetical protein